MIGHERQKYTILENTLAGYLLTCNSHGNPEVQVPMTDRIIGAMFHLISVVSIKYMVVYARFVSLGMCHPDLLVFNIFFVCWNMQLKTVEL